MVERSNKYKFPGETGPFVYVIIQVEVSHLKS